jgi:DNA-binding transcriptional LysR family regulator
VLINYDLLRTLVEIREAGTFAKAAERRRVTPSAISQQIKTLEGQMGVALFERVGRAARLTDAGERLVLSLREAFGRVDEAIDSALDEHSTLRGEVALGGPAPFSRVWLRPRLSRLMRTHSEIVPRVRFGVPSALLRALGAGEIDLCIAPGSVDHPSFASQVVHVERFVAVATPRYIQRHGRPVTAEQFREHAFIVFDEDLAMHATWWRASFGQRADMPTRIACRIASLDEMLALALEGFGIVVLPDYFVRDGLEHGRLFSLAPTRDRATRGVARNPIRLVWRAGHVETARIRLVREALLRPDP